MCVFLKAVGFNHPLLFTGHKTRQGAPLLLLRNVEAHDHQYLHIFISSTNFLSSLLSPRSGDNWGGGPQRPEGSHKGNTAMSLGNYIAEEPSKGGDESVVRFVASKITCCIDS